MRNLINALSLATYSWLFVHAFDDCSTIQTISSEIPIETLNSTKVRYNKMFEITNHKEKLCLKDKNNKINVSLKILEIHDVCKDFELMYYVPRRPKIFCESKLSNSFYLSSSCRDNCEKFHEDGNVIKIFGDSAIPPNCKLMKKDCDVREHPIIPPSCTYWYVKICSDAPRGRDVYSVHKCSSSRTKIKMQLEISENFEKHHTEVLKFENVHDRRRFTVDGVNLTFTLSSVDNIKNDFLNKCFLMNENGDIATVSHCNEQLSGPGTIGEIKCNDTDIANKFAMCDLKGIHIFESRHGKKYDYSVDTLPYENIFSLPQNFSGYRIEKNPEQTGVKVTFTDSIVTFSMQGDVVYHNYEVLENCTLAELKDLELTGYIMHEGASFSISVFANQVIPVHFTCENETYIDTIWTEKSTGYEEYHVSFNPNKASLNISCNITCSTAKRHIRLTGKFRDKNITLTELVTLTVSRETTSEDLSFSPLSLLSILKSQDSVLILGGGILIIFVWCCCCSYACAKDIVILLCKVVGVCFFCGSKRSKSKQYSKHMEIGLPYKPFQST